MYGYVEYGAEASAPPPTPLQEIPMDRPRLYTIPQWGGMGDPARVKFLRWVVLECGRDPEVMELAGRILRAAGVEQRDYARQAAVFLKWVQENISYLNEAGEVIQNPKYTLQAGRGDCDDMAVLLAAFYESVRLPWRFVISGVHRASGRKVRWVEGTPYIPGVGWSHIYVVVGNRPFTPNSWKFAEPTLKGVPLGWDVVSAKSSALPEMAGPATAAGASAGSALATESMFGTDGSLNWRSVGIAVVVGVATSVLSQVALNAVKRALNIKGKE